MESNLTIAGGYCEIDKTKMNRPDQAGPDGKGGTENEADDTDSWKVVRRGDGSDKTGIDHSQSSQPVERQEVRETYHPGQRKERGVDDTVVGLAHRPSDREEVSRFDHDSSGNLFEKFRMKPRNSGAANIVQCFNCKEQGHYKRDCNKPKVFDCYNCGEVGHRAFECKSKRRDSQQGGNAPVDGGRGSPTFSGGGGGGNLPFFTTFCYYFTT